MRNTLVLLEGGHSTLVKNAIPSEVEKDISEAREGNIGLLYLNGADHEEREGVVNHVAVDPTKVVAVVANFTKK